MHAQLYQPNSFSSYDFASKDDKNPFFVYLSHSVALVSFDL